MSLDGVSGATSTGGSKSEASPSPEGAALPGTHWRAVGSRMDGTRKVVKVRSLVGPLRVEVEDTRTGKSKVIMVHSLLTTYERVEANEPGPAASEG